MDAEKARKKNHKPCIDYETLPDTAKMLLWNFIFYIMKGNVYISKLEKA